jgi:hypothetical protein
MDPTANLRDQLDYAEAILDPAGNIQSAEAVALAELVVALNEWLREGGFLPSQWLIHKHWTK